MIQLTFQGCHAQYLTDGHESTRAPKRVDERISITGVRLHVSGGLEKNARLGSGLDLWRLRVNERRWRHAERSCYGSQGVNAKHGLTTFESLYVVGGHRCQTASCSSDRPASLRRLASRLPNSCNSTLILLS